MPKVPRPEFDPKLLEAVLTNLRGELDRRLRKHGAGIYASHHETLGIIAEEYQELIEAITSNDPSEVRKELFDVAVAALFGIVSSVPVYD